MTGGRRDDLRHLVARDAQIAVRGLRRGLRTNADASLDYLISRAYKSPDVLLDAGTCSASRMRRPEHCCTARHGWRATRSNRSGSDPDALDLVRPGLMLAAGRVSRRR
jgi:hypothetical protein